MHRTGDRLVVYIKQKGVFKPQALWELQYLNHNFLIFCFKKKNQSIYLFQQIPMSFGRFGQNTPHNYLIVLFTILMVLLYYYFFNYEKNIIVIR